MLFHCIGEVQFLIISNCTVRLLRWGSRLLGILHTFLCPKIYVHCLEKLEMLSSSKQIECELTFGLGM